MKKNLSKVLVLALILVTVCAFTGCGSSGGGDSFQIAIPNDTTNEARALELLQVQGLITLPEGSDTLATVRDIVDNLYNIEFKEVEAAQIPSVLPDVTYAVINSNYAIEAGLTPFTTEGTDVSYPNVICVKEGNEIYFILIKGHASGIKITQKQVITNYLDLAECLFLTFQ